MKNVQTESKRVKPKVKNKDYKLRVKPKNLSLLHVTLIFQQKEPGFIYFNLIIRKNCKKNFNFKKFKYKNFSINYKENF